jgi:fructose-1,6-bisphosphatase I
VASGVQAFVEHLTTLDAGTGRPYSLRYSGALVGNLHRSLWEDGVYFYPPDNSHKTGKPRLVYECAPLAYVVKQAGGRASTGTQRILDLMPESVRHRVSLTIGSAGDVGLYERFLNAEGRTKGMGIP